MAKKKIGKLFGKIIVWGCTENELKGYECLYEGSDKLQKEITITNQGGVDNDGQSKPVPQEDENNAK